MQGWTPPALPIDEDLLLRFTGQQNVRDPRQAAQLAAIARSKLTEMRWSYFRLKVRYAACRLQLFAARYGIAPVIDALILSSLIAVPAGLAGIFFLQLSPAALIGVIVLAYLGVGGPIAWFLHDPRALTHEHRVSSNEDRFFQTRDALIQFRVRLEAARSEVRSASQLAEGLRRAAAATWERRSQQAARDRLLRANFRGMTGEQFELYLAEVFRLNGLPATRIGQVGDQGVDLIVQCPEGNVAVQAKCYTGSVGNDAVQQVYAGMGFHRCCRCAVITNSAFTRSAWELARSVNCVLIDGSRLPDLIRGKIRI